jgi:hypothetical protein
LTFALTQSPDSNLKGAIMTLSLHSPHLCVVELTVFLAGFVGIVGGAASAADDVDKPTKDYRLVLKLNKHVVRWNDPVTFEATIESEERFVVVGAIYEVQRMSFFHRAAGHTIYIDNEPIDHMPTESFDNLAMWMGVLPITQISPTSYRDEKTTRVGSPGSFIVRLQWAVRPVVGGKISSKRVSISSNWVLIVVEPTREWLVQSPPLKDPDSDEPLDEQEVLERIYSGNEK